MTIHDGCNSPHRRSTCSVIGIPFPTSICTHRDEVCSDMNAFAEHLFKPLFWIFGGSLVVHEDACPPDSGRKVAAMNRQYEVTVMPTNLADFGGLEGFLNRQSELGWEFVALVPEDNLVFRNARWDPRTQTFKTLGAK